MYLEHWNLRLRPFANTPDPRFLWCSRGHEEALTRLFYCIAEEKGAMVLTGDVGCGKTTLSRSLVAELDPERFELALVPRADLPPSDLANEILRQLGLPPACTHSESTRRLAAHVAALYSRGRRTVVVIDECQLASSPEQLDEMRLLLNMQRDDGYNLTLILMGQPEFRATLLRYPQLRQRLALRYHLGPLGEDETPAYLRHRLLIAGMRADACPIFTPEAVALVHRAAGGIPREINNLCDLAMMVAYGRGARVVDESMITDTAEDLAA